MWDAYVDYLAGALDSIPEVDDVRIIVVDNASRVPVPAFSRDVTIMPLPERISVGAARNAALAHVETPLVSFLDADDEFLPGAIDLLRRSLSQGAVAAVGRRVNWEPVSGREAPARRMPRQEIVRLSRHRRLFALLNILINTFPIGTGLCKTAAVRQAGGFGDGDVGEDWVLGAALSQLGRCVLRDEATVRHRVHQGSLWQRPHDRETLLRRCRQVRSRISSNANLPLLSRLVARAAAPLHYSLVRLQVRGDTFTPTLDLPNGIRGER